MIEQVAGYFESADNSDGNPWEVFRVYTPSDQPYTNSLILNNKVFVPIMNSSWDDDALEVYQAALPGHEILGFTGSWESTDALHCRVKGIPDISYMQFESGDVNLDGNLNIQDIVLIINYILDTSDFDSTQLSLADLNVDGAINIQDVILLINLVLEN
tara:strand:- start:72 stop:545 length:474 start_codon:yes stop_codon:yes gene_type:complete